MRVSKRYADNFVVDLRSNNSHGEYGSVEPAHSAERGRVCDLVTLAVAAKALPRGTGAVAKRSFDVASAAGCTVAGEDGDSNHGTAAKSVEDQAKESEEGLAAQAAGEDNGEDGVEDCCTRKTLYGLLPARNSDIAVSLDGKEVGVDSKNDRSAAELQGIECRCDELQRSTAESHSEKLGVDQRA